MIKDKEKTVVFKCFPRNDLVGGLTFWCPYCQRWHLHGRGDGNRVAHCVPGSPLSDYNVKMMSKQELKEIVKAITEYFEWTKNE